MEKSSIDSDKETKNIKSVLVPIAVENQGEGAFDLFQEIYLFQIFEGHGMGILLREKLLDGDDLRTIIIKRDRRLIVVECQNGSDAEYKQGESNFTKLTN